MATIANAYHVNMFWIQKGPDIDATTRYGFTVKAMRNVQKNKIFDAFMIGATLVASALVGIETGYENSTYALS